MNFRLKLLLLSLALLASNAFALDFLYKTNHYPSDFDLIGLKVQKNNIILDVDSYYPTERELSTLKQINLKELTVHAGHFPTVEQITRLDSLGITYNIVLAEVFPSIEEIENINSSKINMLIVKSQDFPTTGEVEIFNKIKIPLTFEILRTDLPLPEHMIVIKQFKKEITLAFNHKMIPGPGYANFFNALRTFKVFKVNEMPYGEDYIGANSLKRSSFKISTNSRPMNYETKVINKFNLAPSITFTNVFPFNQEVFNTIEMFKTNKTIIQDSGNGRLLSTIYEAMLVDTSNVIFSFNQFY